MLTGIPGVSRIVGTVQSTPEVQQSYAQVHAAMEAARMRQQVPEIEKKGGTEAVSRDGGGQGGQQPPRREARKKKEPETEPESHPSAPSPWAGNILNKKV